MLCRTFCMIFGFLLKVEQTFRTKPYYLTKPTLRQILITKQKVLTNNFVSYYNKQAENSEYIKNKEYRNNMNEFKFYGEENTENEDAVQLPEQQAEKEAEKERKYKKHSVLDNTALFLFIVLIAENTILFATRIFSKKKCMQKLCLFYGTVYTCSGRRHFFGIQIYLPLAHNN